jgi:hypothetical protein
MTQLTTQMGALQTSATAQQQQIDSSLKLSHDSLRVELFEKLEDFKNSIGTIPAATGKQELMAELKQYINEKAKTAAATTAANISTSTGSSGPRPVDIRALVPPMTSLKFIPRTIFLKGWCEFGKDSEQGLSSANALKLGVKITSMLDPGLLCHLHADMPRRFSAPFFKNLQLTIFLRDDCPDTAAWDVTSALNILISDNGYNVAGRKVYATPDTELWKKQRNGQLAKANGVLQQEMALPSQATTYLDFPSGSLYVTMPTGEDIKIGTWDENRGWCWLAKLKNIWPAADLQLLDLAMSS